MSEERLDLFGDFAFGVSPAGEIEVTSKATKAVVMRLTPIGFERLIDEMIDRWDEARKVTEANVAKHLKAKAEEAKATTRKPPPKRQ